MRCSGVWLPLVLSVYLPASDWSAVRFVPGEISLSRPGDSLRFLVLARLPDGQEEDVTSRATVSLSAPGIASIDLVSALLTARKTGQAEIRTQFAGLRHSTSLNVGDKVSEVAVRFTPDVISVLTIKGCNSSSCHGSPAGQNGFKLSLFGYDAAADHEMILRKHDGRRVDLAQPERSLLLRKPLFEAPHGGGRLLTRDSEEYRTLLVWLQQGAKIESEGPRLTKLEMYPPERVLAGPGAKARLVVIGRLSDGSTRDMTRQVRYSSSDEATVAVDTGGVVTAGANGLAAIVARGLGFVAAAQIGVAARRAGGAFPKLAANNFIDELAYAKQRQFNVRPSSLSTDREFIRRVFLDTIGLLPTAEETAAFAADSSAGKRARLIDSLLERPEYATLWTVKFEDWFRNNQVNSQGRSMGKFKEWLHDWIAEDRPYDRMVRELITSEGDTFQQPATNFWHPATDFMLKKFETKKVTPTVSRLFLGIRLECAECHNHPLENFTQDDFYGISAFFARMRVKQGTGEYRRTWYVDDEGEIEHPVSKRTVAAKFLGEPAPELRPDADRRPALAAWITSPGNPYFARATVNRIWNEYFQTGIVEPFDDFRSTNPPTNAALLDRLARHFADSGFRLKALHRLILNSRTYQTSSDRGKEDSAGNLERLLFARYQPRKLPAETLLDSISQVTGVPHAFRNHPRGTRAMEVYVPDLPDYFLVAFGFPRRDILCERAKSPTISQALHMINGDSIARKVEAAGNALKGWIDAGWTDEQVVEAIYTRAYARPPSATERESVLEFIAAETGAGRTRRRALEGLLWAVLNSQEFQVNH